MPSTISLEAADGVLELDVLARGAGEGLGHVERLGEEALDLAGARHDQLVLLGELVHAEDGDDVLQLLVALQDALHVAGALCSAPRRRPAGRGCGEVESSGSTAG